MYVVQSIDVVCAVMPVAGDRRRLVVEAKPSLLTHFAPIRNFVRSKLSKT